MTAPANAVREGVDWVRTLQGFAIAAVFSRKGWRPVVTDHEGLCSHLLPWWGATAEEALDYGEFWCWRRKREHVTTLLAYESGTYRNEMPTLDLRLPSSSRSQGE